MRASTTQGGAVTMLVRDDRREHRTWGVASTETGESIMVDSVFYVGSIAKQFVASCVALLEREGALGLDDAISLFVPRLPSWGDRVTIRHLVHHTSGVRERSREGPGVPVTGVRAWGNGELLDAVRDVPELDFVSGSRYGYSNRGYLLLAEAVAVASSSTLTEFSRERIFEPLAMRDSFFRETEAPLPELALRGHFEAADGTVYEEPARFHAVGAGGLWTTASDLATWSANFEEDQLTGGWLPQRLTTRGALDDGSPIHYAWGLSVRTHRGLPIVSHGGSFPGWESKMVRFPTERTTVIVLANREDLDVSAMAFRLADEALQGRIDPDAPHADDTFDGV